MALEECSLFELPIILFDNLPVDVTLAVIVSDYNFSTEKSELQIYHKH